MAAAACVRRRVLNLSLPLTESPQNVIQRYFLDPKNNPLAHTSRTEVFRVIIFNLSARKKNKINNAFLLYETDPYAVRMINSSVHGVSEQRGVHLKRCTRFGISCYDQITPLGVKCFAALPAD